MTTAAPEVAVVFPIDSSIAHAVVELLAVPGDQEQPVVDRDAQAEQGGHRRRRRGQVDGRRDACPTSASPVPTLKTAPTSGISAATIEPNMMSSSTSAQRQADDLRHRVVRLLPDLAGAAAVLDGQPRGPGGLDRRVERVEVRLVERGGHDVPRDAAVGDGAVLRHRRRAVRVSGSVALMTWSACRRSPSSSSPPWPGRRPCPSRVEHDLAAVAAGGREVLLEHVRARSIDSLPGTV